MRVLVTGGTGFVGSHIARTLIESGHNIRLLVRSHDKARAHFESLALPAPDLVQGDVTDLHSIATALGGCDAVVHTAASPSIHTGDTRQLFRVNVQGTANVIGAAVDSGITRIVHLSSLTAIFNTDANRVNETSPLTRSRMPYGRSKVEAEKRVRDLQDQGRPVAIVYPAAVIGPDDPAMSDAFKSLIHRFNEGFRITEGGMQYIDVRDLAEFVVALLEAGETRGRHLVPGPYTNWADLAELLEEVSGYALQKVPARGWVFRAVGRFYDIKRLFARVDSPISAETMRYSTQWPEIMTSDSFTALGLRYRPTEETFRDTLRWLGEKGYLRPDQLPALITERPGNVKNTVQ